MSMSTTGSLGDAVIDVTANLDPLKAAMATAEGVVKSSLGDMAATIGRQMSIALAGILSVGTLKKALSEWVQAEQGLVKLSTAIRLTGQDATNVLPDLQAFANEIQNITTYDDDAIISAMALGKTFGIQTDKLKEATKAAIGLTSRGMGLEQAMRIIARAGSGAATMLARYGIHVDKNMTAAQKQAAVIKQGAVFFAIEEERARTLGGEMQRLGNAWGDTLKSLGQGMSEGGLKATTAAIREQATAWSESMDAMRQSGVLQGITAGALAVARIIYGAMQQVGIALKAVFFGIIFIIESVAKAAHGAVTVIAGALDGLVNTINTMSLKGFGDRFKEYWEAAVELTVSYRDANPVNTINTMSLKGFGDRFKEYWKAAAELTVSYRGANPVDETRKLSADLNAYMAMIEGNGPKAGDNGLKAIGGAMKDAASSGAGESFGIAEAWNKLQKDAEKSATAQEQLLTLKDISKGVQQVAANTGSGAAPLSRAGDDEYLPTGLVE